MKLTDVVLGFNKTCSYCNFSENLQLTKTRIFPFSITHKSFCKDIQQNNFEEVYKKVKAQKNLGLEKAKLLPFSLVYYYYIIQNDSVPTVKSLTQLYLNLFCEKSKNFDLYRIAHQHHKMGYSTILFSYEELLGRICRSYNSFNREIELFLRLCEEPNIKVKYSFQQDYFGGIDLLVSYKGNNKGIACYQKSYRAEYFKKFKNFSRHEDYNFYDIIPMKIDNYNHDCIGDLWVFSKKEYENLLALLKK